MRRRHRRSDPAARSRGLSFSVGGEADRSGSYLIRFKGNGAPDDFAAAVARLGGEVIFTIRSELLRWWVAEIGSNPVRVGDAAEGAAEPQAVEATQHAQHVVVIALEKRVNNVVSGWT